MALSNLVKEKTSLESKIQFVHIGNSFGIDLDNLVEKYKLRKFVKRPGYLPHKKALEEMCSASLLLLLISEGEGKEQISTSKIFEYLYAKKPILALAPPCGAASELVERFKRGKVVSPENTDGIKQGIRFFFEREENSFAADEEDLNIFERKHLTKRLAQVFDDLWK